MQAIRCSKKKISRCFLNFPSHTLFSCLVLPSNSKVPYKYGGTFVCYPNTLEAETGGLPEVHFLEIHCEFQSRPARGRVRQLLGENGRKEEREERKEGIREEGREAKSPVLKHWQALSKEGNSIPHSIKGLSLYTWPCVSHNTIQQSFMLIFPVNHLGRFHTSTCCPTTHLIFWFYPYWLLAIDSVATGHPEQVLHIQESIVSLKQEQETLNSIPAKTKCKCHKRLKSGSGEMTHKGWQINTGPIVCSESQEAKKIWHMNVNN